MLTSLAIALLTLVTPAQSGERLLQVWTEADGLPANQVLGVDQDPSGAIWLGTLIGPVRYDGVHFQTFPPREAQRATRFGAGERFAVPALRGTPLWSIDADAPVERSGKPVTGVRGAWAEGERLWLAQDERVILRDAGTWTTLLESSALFHRVERVGTELFAVGDAGAWRLEPGPPTQLSDAPRLRAWVPFAGGALSADAEGSLVFHGPAGPELWAYAAGYPTNIALRQGVAWVAFQDELLRVEPSGRVERIDVGRLGAIGSLLVDREGSLWLAGNRGVGRYPEPDTTLWSIEDGIPAEPVAHLVLTPDAVWVLTNGATARMDRASGQVQPMGRTLKSPGVCVDRDGTAWSGGILANPFTRVFTRLGQTPKHYPISERDDFMGCATDGERVWLASNDGIYLAGDPPVRAASLPDRADKGYVSFSQSPDGRWWFTEGSRVCSAEGREGLRPSDWRCMRAPGSVYQLAWSEGTLWAAGDGELFRFQDGTWAQVARGLDPRVAVASAVSGGVWLLQIGSLTRLNDQGAVVERLGPRNGILDGSPTALHEDADGTLWIGSRSGLTRVPPTARRAPTEAPAASIVEVSIDGEPRPIESGFALPYANNRISVVAAALTYRDPDHVRYRMEVNGRPQRIANDNTFRFLGLAPGHYALSVAASVDGDHWSATPATLSFDVLRPPWLQWWAIALYVLGIGAVALGIHRARVAHLIGLERQRARIALDLHDEVGSGLGSIGLIAGALAHSGEGNAAAAETIAATSAELGDALTDIVWALRPDSERPEELLAFLAQRGGALCEGAGLELVLSSPEPLPRGPLSLPVRRNLSAIALEAMHNAAKYSRGTQVALGLEEGRPLWRLWISDDGMGIDPNAPIRPGGGSGLEGMRKRAADIGAELEVDSGPEGTRIEVRFRPDATDRRIR